MTNLQGNDKLFQTRAITKTVNPKWEETFDSFVDNPFRELIFQVRENGTNRLTPIRFWSA